MDHVARSLIQPWFLSNSKPAVIPAQAGIHFAVGVWKRNQDGFPLARE
jgi:hypothetical protein